MSGKILLDTNAVIAIFAGEVSIRAVLGEAECLIPSIVAGELCYGAERSADSVGNLTRVQAFLDKCPVVACDRYTAAEYGKLKNELRAAGRPIPENDLWIAALARQIGLPIVSRDNHFDHVTGLTRNAW